VSAGLGLSSPYLYLQLRLVPNRNFTVHLDVVTDLKFAIRISLSNRYKTIKRVGTVVQLPCPQTLIQTMGRWSVLALDMPYLVGALIPASDGNYASLKSIVACCTLSLRAAFLSDQVCARPRACAGNLFARPPAPEPQEMRIRASAHPHPRAPSPPRTPARPTRLPHPAWPRLSLLPAHDRSTPPRRCRATLLSPCRTARASRITTRGCGSRWRRRPRRQRSLQSQ
jgi:hypothetical protein